MGAFKFVSFDLEIAKELPEERKDWLEARPLGISCAATLTSEGFLHLWHGAFLDNPHEDELYPAQMSQANCQFLASYLLGMRLLGYTVLTWNGCGFDLDILAEECADAQCRKQLIDLAFNHIDIAFAMLCEKGFMIGLDTAAKGMGLPGKTKGMRGDLAPKMWKESREAQEKVLEYVAQDVYTTAELYMRVEEKKRLTWISQSGRFNRWQLSKGTILPVHEALELPEPDTSWMSEPWPRSKFYGWMETNNNPKEETEL